MRLSKNLRQSSSPAQWSQGQSYNITWRIGRIRNPSGVKLVRYLLDEYLTSNGIPLSNIVAPYLHRSIRHDEDFEHIYDEVEAKAGKEIGFLASRIFSDEAYDELPLNVQVIIFALATVYSERTLRDAQSTH